MGVSDRARRARLAVPIDAENGSARQAQAVFEAIAKLGEARVRRIYGDVSNRRPARWSAAIRACWMVPCHQEAHARGRNAADIAFAIGAMDPMHRERAEGFDPMPGESGFTRLAKRLRQGGMAVYGFGESNARRAFLGACHRLDRVETGRNGASRPSRNVYRRPER